MKPVYVFEVADETLDLTELTDLVAHERVVISARAVSDGAKVQFGDSDPVPIFAAAGFEHTDLFERVSTLIVTGGQSVVITVESVV